MGRAIGAAPSSAVRLGPLGGAPPSPGAPAQGTQAWRPRAEGGLRRALDQTWLLGKVGGGTRQRWSPGLLSRTHDLASAWATAGAC